MDSLILQTSHDGYQGAMEALHAAGFVDHKDYLITDFAGSILDRIEAGARQLIISSDNIGECGITNGAHFARVVKEKNPQAFFFILSVYNPFAPSIDGVILKTRDKSHIPKLQQLVKQFKAGAPLDELKAILK